MEWNLEHFIVEEIKYLKLYKYTSSFMICLLFYTKYEEMFDPKSSV